VGASQCFGLANDRDKLQKSTAKLHSPFHMHQTWVKKLPFGCAPLLAQKAKLVTVGACKESDKVSKLLQLNDGPHAWKLSLGLGPSLWLRACWQVPTLGSPKCSPLLDAAACSPLILFVLLLLLLFLLA
jgi:hypothetical protein